METPNYHLDELIEMIDEPNKTSCRRIFGDNSRLFILAKGSAHNHQAWTGGYLTHLRQAMNLAVFLYDSLRNWKADYMGGFPEGDENFTLSDALLTLYLHDLEKPWKYGGVEEALDELKNYPNDKTFVKAKTEEYGFELTDAHWNAINFVHGEGEDHDKFSRVQKPLAAFIHVCDTISARIWYGAGESGFYFD
jgi:hypothetical protein